MNIERYAISVKHLVKYLKDMNAEIDRQQALQLIVKENPQILIGNKFRVFKDLSIEIPYNFSDKEFDEFLIEIDKRGLYKTKESM